MPYADFTLVNVIDNLGLKVAPGDLFQKVAEIEPSSWLRQTMALVQDVPLPNEKSRSEFLVAPILLECRARSANRFTIHSGEGLNVDAEKGLFGECEFVLSFGPSLPVLLTPFAILLEASCGIIEESLGQCAAQMLGVRLFNEKREGHKGVPIFGCVTTGNDWQFMRLDGSLLTIDRSRYYLTQLPLILGIFQAMLASCGVDAAAA